MARVEKAGKGFNVVHDTSGEVLAHSSTETGARAKAKEIRARNRTSATRSARSEAKHGK